MREREAERDRERAYTSFMSRKKFRETELSRLVQSKTGTFIIYIMTEEMHYGILE